MNIDNSNSGVYIIKCLSNNKIYVGSSVNIKKRINRHFNDLKNGKHSSPQLQNTFNKYGDCSFNVEIIEEFTNGSITLKELHSIEQKYLDKFKPYLKENGFNTCPIAGSPNQIKLTEETKKKISNSLKGRKRTQSECENISKGKKGKRMNQDSIEKMRFTKTGQKQSEESIEKRARDYSLIDSNGVIYKGKNLKRFCDEHELHRNNIIMVLNGKRKSHHGFKLYKN